jgi:hypothetical protein
MRIRELRMTIEITEFRITNQNLNPTFLVH